MNISFHHSTFENPDPNLFFQDFAAPAVVRGICEQRIRISKEACEGSHFNGHNAELQEIWTHFDENPNVFLARSEGDQPRVRLVTLVHLKNRLYATTSSDNAKVKQIEQNPKIEFCLLFRKGERKGTTRTEYVDQNSPNQCVKVDVFNNIPFPKESWRGPEDPNYTVILLG